MKHALSSLILAGAFAAAVPAFAHHSFAATYFEDKSVTVEGRLVDFDFRNPHSFVTVEVPDGQGSVDMYLAEWSSAGRLVNDGVSKDTFHPGDHVVLTGSPGKNAGEHKLHLKKISRPADGFQWAQKRR